MHLVHEFMEMHAPFGADRDRSVKQIHEHGLAPAHIAPDVEALGRFALAPEQGGQNRARMGFELIEPFGDLLQFFDSVLLRRVGLDLPGDDHVGIRIDNGARGSFAPGQAPESFALHWLIGPRYSCGRLPEPKKWRPLFPGKLLADH